MSSLDDTDLTVEQIDNKLEVLGQSLPDERVETLEQQRAELAGEADSEDSPAHDGAESLEEALREFDPSTLNDVDALDKEIEQRQEKLSVVGKALPDDRVGEVRSEIEALRAARDAHSEVRLNSPEALAARVEGDR